MGFNEFISKLFGNKATRDMKEIQPWVNKVKAVYPEIAKLSHDELRAKTEELKKRIKDSAVEENKKIEELKASIESTELEKREAIFAQIDKLEKEVLDKYEVVLNEILPEAFAIVKDTARRLSENEEIEVTATEFDRELAAQGRDFVRIEGDKAIWKNHWKAGGNEMSWNMVHYDVQLFGGVVLHQGKIAEMATGEGKTLVATLPVFLNALTGNGVHVVTVNDYLAKRDSEWMGPLYMFHGLRVDCIDKHQPNSAARRRAYMADITFGTNNEFGFDYLRDNMAISPKDLVQRKHNYAIVDEVDSVLIDEARTPLIISGSSGKSTKIYEACDNLVRQLKKGTEKELSKMDIIMKEDNNETGDYVANEKEKTVNLTEQGIKKVERFFHLENLADPENLEIQHCVNLSLRAHALMHLDKDYVVKDDEVLIVDEFTGRIMPGRRYSDGLHQAIEAKEHVKVKRESKTLATITFQNFFNKFDKKAGMTGTALTEEKEFRGIYNMDVVEVPTNKPIARIDHNDAVFKTMKGKFNAVVEEVVAAHEKGQPVLVGTITIDTSELLSEMLRKRGIPHNVLNAKYHELEAQIVSEAGRHGAVTIATNMAGRGTDIKLDEEARAAGGLKIIGTERHESRRIDNQLRGRAGRQGDPGESRFYISLEDNLMRLFAQETLMNTFNRLGVGENDQIEHKLLSNAIETAQKKIETNNYGIRLHLLEYDQVMNEQREIIYDERRRVLDGENMRDSIFHMITDFVENTVDANLSEEQDFEEWDLGAMNRELLDVIPTLPPVTEEDAKDKEPKEIKHLLKERAAKAYEEKEAQFPEAEHLREVERVFLLRVIDAKWMDHIDDMDQLRQGIGLQAYGQRDPLVEYKMIGYDMFGEMTRAIEVDTVRLLFHVNVEQKVEREQVAKVTGTNKDDSVAKGPKVRAEKKIYPNDPCPCGSGKKYKQCCGRK